MNQTVLQAKKDVVAEIAEGLKSSASVTLVSYQGLTVAELQELRRELGKVDASLAVYKNTLIRRALAEANQPDMGDLLNGPNALVFSKDLAAAPKALVKFSRYHEALVIKGGLGEGQLLDAAKVKEISKLPGRDGLLSMFLSVLNAPITRFAATVKALSEKTASASAPSAN